MFKVLLYLWLIITIVLIGIIVLYLVQRVRSIYQKKQHRANLKNHISGPKTTSITHEEVVIENDNTGETVTITKDTVVQVTESIEIAGDDKHLEEVIVEASVAIDESVESKNDTEDENDEEGDKLESGDNEAESNNEEKEDKPQQAATTIGGESQSHDNKVVVGGSGYGFTPEPSIMIEKPKDLDASINIAKGHSRDDIVRDKFEKHIQKIRYESGILKQRNDMLGYEKKLVEGITLLPSDKDFQKQLADLYFHQGKYKKAQSLLKKILADNPEDHNALWQVGEIAMEEGQTDDAYVYFSQAINLCDDNPKYCFSLAQWYYDKDDLEHALPLMEKMVKLRPKSIDYLVSLSHVQHKMGLRDEAKASLMRALELDPMNITLKNYLKAL